MKYKFSSMQSLADYFANKALEARNARIGMGLKSRRFIEYTERASVFENVADMIRNTEVGVDSMSKRE